MRLFRDCGTIFRHMESSQLRAAYTTDKADTQWKICLYKAKKNGKMEEHQKIGIHLN